MTENQSDLRDWDIHRDDTHCPEANEQWEKCDLRGTGIHERPDLHLMNHHHYSQDRIDGIRLGARVFGNSEEKALWLVHQFVLLFEKAGPPPQRLDGIGLRVEYPTPPFKDLCVYCREAPADAKYDRCTACRTWRDAEWCEQNNHPLGEPPAHDA